MMYRNKKWFALIPVVIAAAILFFGWVVTSLWNAILVPAAGAGVISFWQGLGLLVLSRILVGGFGGGRGGGRWGNRPSKQKWAAMSEDEKLRFKQEWQRRCGQYPKTDTDAPIKNEGIE